MAILRRVVAVLERNVGPAGICLLITSRSAAAREIPGRDARTCWIRWCSGTTTFSSAPVSSPPASATDGRKRQHTLSDSSLPSGSSVSSSAGSPP